jgi:nucleotide-binding universal stress UspA family protein
MAIETVLIVIGEESEQRAETLARVAAEEAGASAEVIVGYTFTEEDFASAVKRFGFDRSADQLSPGDVAARVAPVQAAHSYLDDEGVDASVYAEIGEGGPEMFVRMSANLEADRVVVGGDRRSPAGKAVFGSDAQTILLDAVCPVVYVGGDVE